MLSEVLKEVFFKAKNPHYIWGLIALFILSLSIAGYPLAATLLTVFDIEHRFFTIPFRIFILALSLILIQSNFCTLKKRINKYYFPKLFLLFWAIYLFRIAIDFKFYPEALRLPAHEYLAYSVGMCALPAVSLISFKEKILLNRGLLIVIFIALLSNLMLLYIKWDYLSANFMGLSFSSIRLELKALNSISISHQGYILSTLLLFYITLDGKISWKNIVLLPLFWLGVVIGQLGGSRGPLVVFLLSYIAIITYNIFFRKISINKLLFVIVNFVFYIAFLFVSNSPNISRNFSSATQVAPVVKNNPDLAPTKSQLSSSSEPMSDRDLAPTKSQLSSSSEPMSDLDLAPTKSQLSSMSQLESSKIPLSETGKIYFMRLDPSDKVRMQLWTEGFNVFLKSPFFGAGIEPMGFWPHNTILEAFMMGGVLVGLIYFSILSLSAYYCFQVIRHDYHDGWISIIFLQFLLIAMVNSSLYLSCQLWISSAMLFVAWANNEKHCPGH